MAARCPSPDLLARFRRAELEGAEALDIRAHLALCPAYREALDAGAGPDAAAARGRA